MYKLFIILFTITLFACSETRYYIVRHAEKETTVTTTDPPLTKEGELHAKDLKYFLQGKKIKHIFSTNYVRTLATAEPTRQFFGIKIEIYDPKNIGDLVEKLKKINDGNVLVVSHSNLVDDIVNGLTGEKKVNGDLPDSEYGMIYKVTQSAKKYKFEKMPLPKAG